MRGVAERHLALLHHLEQRGLHLGRGAVDLIGEQEVAEDRAELGVEARIVRAIDPRADEVGRDEVRRELDPVERAAEHLRGRLHRQRLREARYAFDQQVAARQQADEHALEHLILAGDHPPDLEQGLLELLHRLGGGRRFVTARHVLSFGRYGSDPWDGNAGTLGGRSRRAEPIGRGSGYAHRSRDGITIVALHRAAATWIAHRLRRRALPNGVRAGDAIEPSNQPYLRAR